MPPSPSAGEPRHGPRPPRLAGTIVTREGAVMAHTPGRSGPIGMIVLVVGIVFAVAGVATYVLVANELAAENITVSAHAKQSRVSRSTRRGRPARKPRRSASTPSRRPVARPTPSLGKDDPFLDTVMQALFLRASRIHRRRSPSARRRSRKRPDWCWCSSASRCVGSGGRRSLAGAADPGDRAAAGRDGLSRRDAGRRTGQPARRTLGGRQDPTPALPGRLAAPVRCSRHRAWGSTFVVTKSR